MSFFYISDDLPTQDLDGGSGVATLVASGDIDFAASPQLRECIADHIAAGHSRLMLDLSTVKFIDSTAIGVLVGAVARLQETGEGSLTIVCGPENVRVRRIFDIAGVDSMLALHDSREEALSALAAAH